uniref:Perilipin-2-like n=1 Tax=Paramormyrops kingsleyae TaxID=1676925 RepID=A0A3B3RH02_9TELE
MAMSSMKRLLDLPLVSSTCYLVSVVYCNMKESHPRVKPFCEVAETGVKTIASVAATGAAPIIVKFQPQIAGANQLMCKYLDKTEEAFPVLQQLGICASNWKVAGSNPVNARGDTTPLGP